MAKKTNYIGVNFGNFTLKVLNAREVYGHDDTWPFNAEFEVTKNGLPFLSGTAWNDGWGGPTCVGYERNAENIAKEQELDDACAVFNYKDTRYNFDMTHSFADIVEIMAYLYGGSNNGKVFATIALLNYLKRH